MYKLSETGCVPRGTGGKGQFQRYQLEWPPCFIPFPTAPHPCTPGNKFSKVPMDVYCQNLRTIFQLSKFEYHVWLPVILEARTIPDPSLFLHPTVQVWFHQWECPCLNILQVLQLSRIILPVRFHWNWHNPLPLTSHYIWWERKTISNILGKEIFFGAGQGGRDYDFPERLWLWIPASASLNSLSLLCILLLSFLFFADSPQIKKFILLCHSQQFSFLQPWLQTYLQIYFYIFKTNQQKAC